MQTIKDEKRAKDEANFRAFDELIKSAKAKAEKERIAARQEEEGALYVREHPVPGIDVPSTSPSLASSSSEQLVSGVGNGCEPPSLVESGSVRYVLSISTPHSVSLFIFVCAYLSKCVSLSRSLTLHIFISLSPYFFPTLSFVSAFLSRKRTD